MKGRAFTLLEMMIVLTIVAILATLLLPVYGHLRERAQKAQCMANLRSLYVATDSISSATAAGRRFF